MFNAQKMKFSINDFFSKCQQTGSSLRICHTFTKEILMNNFIFCAVVFSLDDYIILPAFKNLM